MSKTSYVAGLVVAVWVVIAFRLTGVLAADAVLLLAGLAATGFAIWYVKATQSFAERNPAQALLEGAELLEWQRLEAAAKGIGAMPGQPLIEVKPPKLLEGDNG